MTPLTPQDINSLGQTLPLWRLEAGAKAILRDLVFADFKQAFVFMTAVAAEADRTDHHPEWFNVYNCVNIRLTTHDADGLSDRDMAMAQFIDTAAAQYGGK